MTWHEGELGEVAERGASLTLLDRIADVLGDGEARSVSEVAAEMNEGIAAEDRTASATVKATLFRALKRDGAGCRFTVADSQWRLRDVRGDQVARR